MNYAYKDKEGNEIILKNYLNPPKWGVISNHMNEDNLVSVHTTKDGAGLYLRGIASNCGPEFEILEESESLTISGITWRIEEVY